jgi:hypothetical protein
MVALVMPGTTVATLDNDEARSPLTTDTAVVVITARQARTPHAT